MGLEYPVRLSPCTFAYAVEKMCGYVNTLNAAIPCDCVSVSLRYYGCK